MFEPSIIYYDTLYPSSNGISVGNNKMTITFMELACSENASSERLLSSYCNEKMHNN